MRPLIKYLNNLFAKQRLLGDDTVLQGMAKADALLLGLINTKKVPGLAITVLKEGKVLFQKGYGHADIDIKTPIDPKTTLFRTASVSKPIAATALAYMVSEGTIDLDASFYIYVPYYPKKQYDFTIRQLAGHTAGIRAYQGIEYGLNKPYTIKESVQIFKDDDLLFEPGTGYRYNSYDWVLVSLAMQEASGIPFEVYVQEKVLGPLGMVSTIAPERYPSHTRTTPVVSGLTSKIASFYSKNKLGFRKAIPVNNFYKLAGGGYLSTSEDIAKFGNAYLEGTILDQTTLAPFLTAEHINGDSTYYGLGWQVSTDSMGRPFYGHVGNGVGGYSNFFVYPEEQTVFAILINCTDPKVQETLDEVVEVILESQGRLG